MPCKSRIWLWLKSKRFNPDMVQKVLCIVVMRFCRTDKLVKCRHRCISSDSSWMRLSSKTRICKRWSDARQDQCNATPWTSPKRLRLTRRRCSFVKHATSGMSVSSLRSRSKTRASCTCCTTAGSSFRLLSHKPTILVLFHLSNLSDDVSTFDIVLVLPPVGLYPASLIFCSCHCFFCFRSCSAWVRPAVDLLPSVDNTSTLTPSLTPCSMSETPSCNTLPLQTSF
mmetsp:Transcript_3775/g.23808  ORF Transcript_3775/g.23808 Transcript_3775/m.23808 type:complete len:226 (-) Transcript_3775:2249-2926(-)